VSLGVQFLTFHGILLPYLSGSKRPRSIPLGPLTPSRRRQYLPWQCQDTASHPRRPDSSREDFLILPQVMPFNTFLNTAALLHRKPVAAGISCDSCGAENYTRDYLFKFCSCNLPHPVAPNFCNYVQPALILCFHHHRTPSHAGVSEDLGTNSGLKAFQFSHQVSNLQLVTPQDHAELDAAAIARKQSVSQCLEFWIVAKDTGENCIMRSFMIYAPHQVSFR
jgi:hypothetical protein